MIKTDLNIIEANSGSVYHALKNTDKGFKESHVKVFNTGKLEIPGIQSEAPPRQLLVEYLRCVGRMAVMFQHTAEDEPT